MHGPVYEFLKKEGDISFWKNIIFMSVLSGIANSGLLAVINLASRSAENEALNYRYLAIYVVIFLIFYITKNFTMVESGAEVERIVKNTRERISDKIRKSELITLEKLDSSQTLRRLARNGTTIAQSSVILISIIQSSIMIFFVFVYIFYLSHTVFFAIFFSLSLATLIYVLMGRDLIYDIRKNRKVEDKFFYALNLIINGFNELKMNSKKRKIISKETHKALDELLASRIHLIKKATTGVMFTEVFLYIVLGVIVFIIPHLKSEESITIVEVTAAMLFIIGRLEETLSVGPTVIKTVSSIQSITRLEDALDKGVVNQQMREDTTIAKFNNFKEITLKEIEFYYKNEENEKIFGVGPLNLTLKRGEMVFIVGGNGSGKSTFIKTLLALYQTEIGGIYIDDTLVPEETYQIYRDLFTIILTDFHLFHEVYGIENINYDLVNKLLVEMQLDKKTALVEGKFSTIDLSTGQKKRLALIIAILEDKPIYVFDEWAADQDPEFRKYFYTTILKELKQKGKTIIAVTHDDAYFGEADRVLKMDYGQISQYKGEI